MKFLKNIILVSILGFGVNSAAQANDLTIWNQNQTLIDVSIYSDGSYAPQCGSHQVTSGIIGGRPNIFTWGKLTVPSSLIKPNTHYCVRATITETNATAERIVYIANPGSCELIIAGLEPLLKMGWDTSRCNQ